MIKRSVNIILLLYSLTGYNHFGVSAHYRTRGGESGGAIRFKLLRTFI